MVYISPKRHPSPACLSVSDKCSDGGRPLIGRAGQTQPLLSSHTCVSATCPVSTTCPVTHWGSLLKCKPPIQQSCPSPSLTRRSPLAPSTCPHHPGQHCQPGPRAQGLLRHAASQSQSCPPPPHSSRNCHRGSCHRLSLPLLLTCPGIGLGSVSTTHVGGSCLLTCRPGPPK